ncbi:NUMOD4 domain-containing protein [uncultured Chryseobacterium sp.]|uniref:NUMOD4 domain-containing protein n=1 Tax=uncultured Chryseobacterium sp. TaxID=259322 RepID=UPI0025E28491|nr:NUMOD4 domain-containing protein [uncultured Chryseobacterium sp.]
MKEIWIDIDDTNEDYQVSNHGRIKSKARTVEYPYQNTFRSRKISEKILTPKIRKTGDRIDCVEYSIRNKNYLISRLVYFYFKSREPVPAGYCIAHKDKNPLNNNVDNLIKITWSESRKLDFQLSTREKSAQLSRSKKGGAAMRNKALLKRIKFFYPHE